MRNGDKNTFNALEFGVRDGETEKNQLAPKGMSGKGHLEGRFQASAMESER